MESKSQTSTRTNHLLEQRPDDDHHNNIIHKVKTKATSQPPPWPSRSAARGALTPSVPLRRAKPAKPQRVVDFFWCWGGCWFCCVFVFVDVFWVFGVCFGHWRCCFGVWSWGRFLFYFWCLKSFVFAGLFVFFTWSLIFKFFTTLRCFLLLLVWLLLLLLQDFPVSWVFFSSGSTHHQRLLVEKAQRSSGRVLWEDETVFPWLLKILGGVE